MGEVVSPQNMYADVTYTDAGQARWKAFVFPVAWPAGPLSGFRGTGAQDSLRTSTLTKDSWEGRGG